MASILASRITVVVWCLLATVASAAAHDVSASSPEGPINLEVITDLLESAKSGFQAADKNSSGYLPNSDEIARLAPVISRKGKMFGAGFMLDRRSEGGHKEFAYLYLYGSGMLQWVKEEWNEVFPGGSSLYIRWKFFENRASLTISVRDVGGAVKDVLYEHPLDTSSRLVIEKSKETWQLLLGKN